VLSDTVRPKHGGVGGPGFADGRQKPAKGVGKDAQRANLSSLPVPGRQVGG